MHTDNGPAACEQLVHAFAWHIDHHDAAQAAALFAADAVFERRGEALRGRDAIRAAFLARPRNATTRHVCSNLLLTTESPRRIIGRTYFTVYRDDGDGSEGPRPLGQPAAVGEYHDVFELTDQGWRIAHRSALPVFIRPA